MSGWSPRTALDARSRSPAAGLLARALQHELDHLAGKLYIDYLDSMDDLIPVAQARPGDDVEAAEPATPLA